MSCMIQLPAVYFCGLDAALRQTEMSLEFQLVQCQVFHCLDQWLVPELVNNSN
jgi:hypothetical protein